MKIKFYQANGYTNFFVTFWGSYANGYIYRAGGKTYVGGCENVPEDILNKIADRYERMIK